MRLGYKSRAVLDTILFAGLDALDFLTFPSKYLYRTGDWEEERYLARHLKKMQDEGWIVWDDSRETGKWVLKITAAGKSALMDEIDPVASWGRPWDGKWRLVAFDLPASKQKLRQQLLKWLREKRFGRLQDSLWITPQSGEAWQEELAKLKFDPAGISFLEGTSFARSSDSDFVEKSWNFGEINRRYSELMDFYRSSGAGLSASSWTVQESALWRSAFEKDPFLPDALLPRGYLGKEAFSARKRIFADRVARIETDLESPFND